MPYKALKSPLKGLIRPFKGLIRPFRLRGSQGFKKAIMGGKINIKLMLF